MGVNTKAIVTKAAQVNLFELANQVATALRPFTYTSNGAVKIKSQPSIQISHSGSKYILVDFKVQDPSDHEKSKARGLFIFFDCQSDHPGYEDDHISLSIGCWGESVDIITQVAFAILKIAQPGARAFVLADDSGSDSYEEVLLKGLSEEQQAAVIRQVLNLDLNDVPDWLCTYKQPKEFAQAVNEWAQECSLTRVDDDWSAFNGTWKDISSAEVLQIAQFVER